MRLIMQELHLLSALIFLPLLGALWIALFLRGEDQAIIGKRARATALTISVITFVISLVIYYGFDPSTAAFQWVEKINWSKDGSISYHLGVDGISIFFILLTTLLTPICILASVKNIQTRVKEFMMAFLILETIILGIFCALDFLLFYVFFEAVLIPMFLIIGIWGGEQRVYASIKFFLYTLTGSVLSLIAILYIYHVTGTLDIPQLMQQAPHFSFAIQKWLWLAFFASFAVKVPMWPVHTWLPDAHVQAPTAGSVILAGVLLKLGGYGFLRLALPLLPEASHYFAPLVLGLSIVAVIYTSLVALVQEDMKKMIAYSSVAHMGFVTLGIFAFNTEGIQGAILVMISHGLISSALFLCVGVLYDRVHTKLIKKYGGVTLVMPKFAGLFMLFTMASIGLPATSGFVGELLTMAGLYRVSYVLTALAATGVVLGAAYMLWLYARVMFGTITNPEVEHIKDLEGHEYIALVPLAVLILVIGIYPSCITDVIKVSVEHLLTQVQFPRTH